MAEAATNVVSGPPAERASSETSRRTILRLPRWEFLTLSVWFVAFACLAEFFPRSGDDWAWGSKEGSDRLPQFFQGLNGRYGGDLSILALTRAGALAGIVVSLVVCATAFLLLRIASARTPVGYAFASALFLAMPRSVWREAVVWLSGFVNYAVSALVFVCFFALAQSDWFGRLRQPTRARLALVALAGFLGQFWMEHVSLGICAMGVLLSLWFRRTRKRWPAYILTWTVAAIVGGAVMLANPAYRKAASGNSSYQKTQVFSGPHWLHDLVVKAVDYLPTQTIVNNIALNGAFAVVLIVLVVASGRLRTRLGGAVVALAVVFLGLCWTLSYLERGNNHVREHTRALATVATVILLVALVLAASMVRSEQRRFTLYAGSASLVLIILPLLVVNPVGPRCFFPSYIVLLMMMSVLVVEVAEYVPALARSFVWLPVNLVAAGVLTALFVVYVSITNADNKRLDHVRAAVKAGATEVQFAPMPHSYFAHDIDPYWSVLQKRFKEYYGFPADLKVKLVPNPWSTVKGKHTLPPP